MEALGCHLPFSEEHSKAWWRPFFFTLPSGSRSLVCVSFKNLFIYFVLRFMFWKALRCPWVLRRQAWIPDSPLPCACQVEVEAEGWSELWWSVWSWGQWTPSSPEGQGDPLCGAWRDLTGPVFTVLLSF